MQNTLNHEQREAAASRFRDYAHRAASTAGRIAAADRAKGAVTTAVTGKSTTDRYEGATKRTNIENEHLAFIRSLSLIERLTGVKLDVALTAEPAPAPALAKAPAKTEKLAA